MLYYAREIKWGIPSFHLPPFNFERPISNSSISNSSDPNPGYELVTFNTIIKDLGMGLVMVPIIAILEQVAIAKAFCKYISCVLSIIIYFCVFFLHDSFISLVISW